MNRTRWLIVITVAVIVVIDVYLAATCGKACTISVTITEWSKQYPVIPFLFGGLMAHFFTQNQ